jgi:CheY-like chemotaxis protein
VNAVWWSALERIAAGEHFDLAILDQNMPEMDGLETIRLICEQWPPGQRPYIIAMTANALAGDAEKHFSAGMNGYISKPVQIEKLMAALESSYINEFRKDEI